MLIAEPIFLAKSFVLTPNVDAEPEVSSAETAALFNASLTLSCACAKNSSLDKLGVASLDIPDVKISLVTKVSVSKFTEIAFSATTSSSALIWLNLMEKDPSLTGSKDTFLSSLKALFIALSTSEASVSAV